MGRIALLIALTALITGLPGGTYSDLAASESDDVLQPETQQLDRGRIVPCCYSTRSDGKPNQCELMRRALCYRRGGTVVDGCTNCPIWDVGAPKIDE